MTKKNYSFVYARKVKLFKNLKIRHSFLNNFSILNTNSFLNSEFNLILLNNFKLKHLHGNSINALKNTALLQFNNNNSNYRNIQNIFNVFFKSALLNKFATTSRTLISKKILNTFIIIKNSINRAKKNKFFKTNKFLYLFFTKLLFKKLNLRLKKDEDFYRYDEIFNVENGELTRNTSATITKNSLDISQNVVFKLNNNAFKQLTSNKKFFKINLVLLFNKYLKRLNNVLRPDSDKVIIKTTNNLVVKTLIKRTNFTNLELYFKTPISKNLFDIFSNTNLFKFYTYKNTNCSNFYKAINVFLQKFQSGFFFNIVSEKSFSHHLKKKIIKIFSYQKLNVSSLIWQNNVLIRFIEACSGKKVFIKFYIFLHNTLNFEEFSRCVLWSQKLKNFQKTIGQGLFLLESIQIIYISLKIKDPFFFMNWLVKTLYKISFWKYKLFFHYIKYLFKYFFLSIFKELKMKGIKLKLKGKISVAGNARTRTVVCKIGKVSHSTFDNKILHSFDLIKTFTGVLGLQLWLVF